jgi:hypothetical protein
VLLLLRRDLAFVAVAASVCGFRRCDHSPLTIRGSSNISSGLNEVLLLAVLRLEAALGSGRRVLPEVVVDMVLSIFSVSPQGRCSGGPTTTSV